MTDLIPFEVKDYLEEARGRVTEQFKSADVFDRYLQLLVESQIQIQKVIKDLIQLRDIDTATGNQLDVIGRIVGQERDLIASDLYEFFGFEGALGAQSMGSVSTAEGGIFYSLRGSLGRNVPLDDETYRKFIKAKVYKNVTSSTPNEFIAVVNLIFNTTETYVLEGTDASFTVYFGRELSTFEKSLVEYISYTQAYPTRLLPKPVGVKINYDYTGIPPLEGARGYGLNYGSFYGG